MIDLRKGNAMSGTRVSKTAGSDTVRTGTGCVTALVLALTALPGCGSVPPRHYYTIVNEQTRHASGEPICGRPLVVATVEAVAPYDSSKIVYRTDRFKINFYHYRQWAADPEQMFEELLIHKMQGKNIFVGVERYIHSSLDHLALYTRINALEEVDDGDKWNARLAMDFVLKEPQTDEVLWRYGFDRTERVLEKNPRELVKTLSGIYHSETEKMMARLQGFLSTYDGCFGSEQDQKSDYDEEEQAAEPVQP
jgi:uncharacterized lipoprotein YmbA